MADEVVTIRVDFKANKKDIAKVVSQTKALQEGLDDAVGSGGDFDDQLNKINVSAKKLAGNNQSSLAQVGGALGNMSKQLNRNSKGFSVADRMMLRFQKTARVLFFAVVALVAEFVITATTLASVTAAFKLGNLALKAYNVGLGLVGAALATVTAGVTAALAAFREYNAALTAFQYKSGGIYGDGIAASSAAMRSLTVDTNLATMGVVQLTQAYNVMARSARVTAAQSRALSGSMDFMAGTEDVNKSFQAMANFVGLLTKNKRVTSEVSGAAANVSKEFADAIKKQKNQSAASILSAMASGQLVADAGVEGNFKSLTQTLVAMFKRYITFLARDLSDFGDLLLNKSKEVLDSYYKNIRDTFAKLTPEFRAFAEGPLFKSLISIGNWFADFTIKLMTVYLPKIEGGMGWLRKTFNDIQKSFFSFANSLDKFRKGSEIIVDAFGEPLLAIFRGFGRNAEQLAYLAEDNREEYLAWGQSLERLIFSIFDFFGALKVAFTEALPVLTSVVNALSSIVDFLSKIISSVGTLSLFGTGGGKSGTVGAGMGPGIGTLVTAGALYAAYKGRRYAYRDRFYNAAIASSPGSASSKAAKMAGGGFMGMGGGLLPMEFGTMSSGAYAARMGRVLSREMSGRDVATGAFQMGGRGGMQYNPYTGAAIGDAYGAVTSGNARISSYFSQSAAYAAGMPAVGAPGRRKAELELQRIYAAEQNALSQSVFGYQRGGIMGREGGLGIFRPRRGGNLSSRMASLIQQDAATAAAYEQFLAQDQSDQGRQRYKGANDPRALRDFAKLRAQGRIGSFFAGGMEGGQAALRRSFSPTMGIMGGLALATGVTGKIGDEDLRRSAESALGLGSMFGVKGMLVAGGLSMASSMDSRKAALGGLAAGAGAGKVVSDVLTGILGPKGAVAGRIIQGVMAIGGAVYGVIKAGERREKFAQQIASETTANVLRKTNLAMLGYAQQGDKLVQIGPMSISRGMRTMEAMYGRATAFGNKDIGTMTPDQMFSEAKSLYDLGIIDKNQYDAINKFKKIRTTTGKIDTNALDTAMRGIQEQLFGTTTGGDIRMPGRIGGAYTTGALGQITGLAPGVASAGTLDRGFVLQQRANYMVSSISRATGMSEADILALAGERDVNLFEAGKSLTSSIKELGLTMVKTTDQINQSLRSIQVDALRLFDSQIEARNATRALTASGNALRQAGADASYEQFADYARTLQQFYATTQPDNPFAYLEALQNLAGGAMGGTAMTGGLASAFTTTGAQKTISGVALKTAGGYGKTAREQLMGNLLQSGFIFQDAGADLALQSALNGIFMSSAYSATEKQQLMNVLGSQMIDADTGQLALGKLSGAGRAGAALASTLGGSKFALQSTEAMNVVIAGAEGEALKQLGTEMGNAFVVAIDKKPEFWETVPKWWQQMLDSEWTVENNTIKINPSADSTPDTRSPRRGAFGDTPTSRALKGTMRSHSFFNSMLTGKRFVTSSLRFDNLGSPSSDHAAGRAFDLVGQNLGQYQKLVSEAGGFAEFHGRGGSRHLHVVPPLGDTATSRAGYGSGGSNMSQNVTVNVYGAPGQSEAMIAKHVVNAIAERERMFRERS